MTGQNASDRPPLRLLTLDHLDGRTAAAKRARDLVAGLEEDAGGADHITVAVRQLCQRAAILGALIEDSEARWLGGVAGVLTGLTSGPRYGLLDDHVLGITPGTEREVQP